MGKPWKHSRNSWDLSLAKINSLAVRQLKGLSYFLETNIFWNTSKLILVHFQIFSLPLPKNVYFQKIYWCRYCISIYEMFSMLSLSLSLFLSAEFVKRIKASHFRRLTVLQCFLIFPKPKITVFEMIFYYLYFQFTFKLYFPIFTFRP